MAIQKLYYRIIEDDFQGTYRQGSGIVRLEYDDTTHHVVTRELGNAHPFRGLYYPDNAIHDFLDPDSYISQIKPEGVDIYLQRDGEYLYQVQKVNNFPNYRVKATFFKPLEAEITRQDNVSQFGYRDGRYEYDLKHGSGYIYDFPRNPTTGPGRTATKLPGLQTGEYRGEAALYPGDYEQTVRDALTLEDVTVKVTIEEPPCTLLIDSIDVVPESAPGGQDGSITVNATSDNPIEYKLDNSPWQDSNVFSGLTDGEYTLYARDKNQTLCRQEKPVSVEELPCDLVIDEINIRHESFRGVSDGTITVLASSERAIEYAIRLEDEQQTAYQDTNIFPDLPAGNHEVFARLKAANTCNTFQVVRLQPGAAFTANIDHVQCGNAPTGVITLTLADNSFPPSNTPYTYQWEDGTEGHVLEELKPGDYTVQISTKDGRTKDFTFTVNGQPPIQVGATVDQGNVYLSVSGGEAPYTFRWNDGATSQNRQGLDPDTYIVTVTDARGCSKQENIFVRIPQHYFSENKIALEVFAFDLEAKPNFTYVCEIYLEQDYLSDEFTKIGELEHSVDAQGQTVFEVQDYLDAYLEPTLPDVHAAASTGGLVRLDSQFKRFYLRFTEKFGLEPELSTFSQQETFYVLLGGLSFEEYSTKDFFLHYLPEQRPFYTWQPVEKEVFPDQPEFLHYLVNDDGLDKFGVWMKLYYPDGNTEEHQIFRSGTDHSVSQYELFRFPAGYEQLSIGGYSCQTCYQYELYVTDGNDVQISQTRRYLVNHEYYEERNYFFFLNSLGCYDTLAATGRSRYQLGVDEQTVTRELPYDYQPTDRAVEVLQKSGEPEIMQPVGYPTKEMMLSLQDFVISKAYYKWEDDRVIPITVDIRRTTILDKNENLQELNFSYQLPRMEKFTPKLRVAQADRLSAVATVEGRSINLAISGGKPDYSYLWSDGNTEQSRVGLPNGEYSVRITDSSIPPKAYSICELLIDEEPNVSQPYTVDAAWAPETQNVYYSGAAYRFVSEPFPSVASLLPVVTTTVEEGKSYRIRAHLYLPDEPDKFEFYPSNNPKVPGRITLFLGGYDGPFEVTADPTLLGQWQYIESVAPVPVNSYAGSQISSQVVYDIRAFSKYDIDAGASYGPPPMLFSDLTIEEI